MKLKNQALQCFFLFFLLYVLCFAVGCTTESVKPEELKLEEPKPVYKAAWDKHQDGKKFTEITIKALEKHGTGLLAVEKVEDAKTFCPNYSYLNQQQRKAFYIALISAMVQRESNFNTQTSYTESFKDSKGNPIISRGLFQLSQESANQKAYACDIKTPNDLHNPEINVSCGVRILSHWVTKDKAIGTDKKGGGRYWSVLREHSGSRPKIIAKLKELEVCKWL